MTPWQHSLATMPTNPTCETAVNGRSRGIPHVTVINGGQRQTYNVRLNERLEWSTQKPHITCGPIGPSTIKNFLVRSQLFPFMFFYHDQLRILNTLQTVIFPANGYCILGECFEILAMLLFCFISFCS